MGKFVVVSFFTKDNGYENDGWKLMDSLKALKVDYYVEAINSLGDWMRNAHYTHEFIRAMLEKFLDRPIVWTDADSVLRRYPDLFDTIDCDFAAHVHDWIRWRKMGELLCGTMYFANNDLTRGFLDDCIRIDKEFPNRRGAINLSEALKAWKGKLKFQELPPQYCKIYDLMRDVPDSVFEHFQASRRFRQRPIARVPVRLNAELPQARR
jgi:hypothetical protein